MATIKRVRGTFVEMSLGDVVAVMPLSEFSWSRSCDVRSELGKLGGKVVAVVVAMRDGAVMLSVKRLSADPWLSVDEIYKVGMRVRGKVRRILNFGAFVGLDNGIDGLLHKKFILESSGCKSITSISEGDEIEVKITMIDKAERRMSFSMIY